MNAKSLMLFLAVAGVVVWFGLNGGDKEPVKPVNPIEPYQKQIDKSKAVERQMQQAADGRMDSSDVQ